MVMTRLIHTTLAVQLGTTAELALWTHQVVFLARARQMQLMPACDSTYATSPAPSVDSSAVYHQSRYLSCCFRKCMSSFPDTEMVTTHVCHCVPLHIFTVNTPPRPPPPPSFWLRCVFLLATAADTLWVYCSQEAVCPMLFAMLRRCGGADTFAGVRAARELVHALMCTCLIYAYTSSAWLWIGWIQRCGFFRAASSRCGLA